MAFNTRAQTNTQSSGGSQSTVDWVELDKYRVETAGLQKKETLLGYISMIVDLGVQDQEDAQLEWTGTEEQKEKRIAEKPNTYFKMIDGKEYVCWPNKPQQCVAIAVDFPDIITDVGQFFGESNPLPLRLWLGGQFFFKDFGMCVSSPASLRVVNLNKDRKGTPIWSLAQNNVLYRMAEGAGLVTSGESFLPERIDELLGKSFQWQAQIFFRKNKGKEYYTEYLKFVGGLARGQEELELLTDPMLLQFTEDNDEDALRTVRSHVINTMKRSVEFEGSKIQKQLDAVRGQNNSSNEDSDQEDDEPEQEAPVKEKAKAPVKKAVAKKQTPPPEEFDSEELPF